jgi:predicted small integral membrane protein
MAVRLLKIVLVLCVGLQGFLYVAGNVANWEAGIGAVGYVIGMQGHEVYPTHIFPSVTHPTLVTLAFLMILAGESLVGALCVKGAWDLWRVRSASAEAFNAAKTFALIGTAMAMVVWFGGFIVIGGALFQMWQTQLGAGSFDDAFVFAATGGLIFLLVSRPDG